ncbi:hypothetical protein B0T19DRAFT_440692 [Cercophora scortea]|uniref:Uncharacterized protein n=1 Tax=Cercophora scortea TaxID=314031 RepID=A0AAE0IZ80_9PEZI|nr:hypothetical protein B0T19DRAFT_440692 [Cercophora scortea]
MEGVSQLADSTECEANDQHSKDLASNLPYVLDHPHQLNRIYNLHSILGKLHTRPRDYGYEKENPKTGGDGTREVLKGTVECRIHQLDRTATRPDTPLAQRDRDSELIGWGRKLGPEARFVRPATHSQTIEVRLSDQSEPRHTFDGSLLQPHPPKNENKQAPLTVGDSRRSTMFASLPELLARPSQRGSSSGPRQRNREASAPSVVSYGTGQSYTTTPGGRRQAARQLFEQIMPQAICSSCGHLRCQQCTREFSEATTDAPQAAAVDVTPARPETPEAVPAETTPLARQDKRASNKSEQSVEMPENSEPASTGKRGSVKNNPFVIADQIAKAKVAEPQTSKTTIRATSVSKLPPCMVIRDDQREHATHKQWEGQQQQPEKAPAQTHNPFFHSHPTDESAYQKTIEATRIAETTEPHNVPSSYPASISSQDLCPHELEWQVGQHNVIPRAPAGSLKVAEARWSPKPSMVEPAETAAQKELSHVIRRVKVIGRESNAAGPVEKVLKVDVSATGDGRHVPKVRVSSPPFWLKNPSTKAGSIEGRLKQIGSKSNPQMSSRPSQQRVVQDEFRHHHHMEDMPFAAVNRSGSMVKDKQHREEGKRASQNPRVDSLSGGAEQIRMARRSLQTTSSRETMGSLSPGTVTGTGTNTGRSGKKETPAHQKTSSGIPTALASHHRHHHQQQETTQQQQRPGMVADMMRRQQQQQQQQQQQMETERAQRAERMERRSLRVVCEPEEGGEGEDGDDVGIRGLTIVLHLRGKDDLVISTDLSRDATGSNSSVR